MLPLTEGSFVIATKTGAPDTTNRTQIHTTPKFNHLFASVDKTDAVTLVLEFPRNRKDSPAALLALTFVGWRANSWGDGHPVGGNPSRCCGNHGVGCRVDHRDGVGAFIRHIGAGPIRS